MAGKCAKISHFAVLTVLAGLAVLTAGLAVLTGLATVLAWLVYWPGYCTGLAGVLAWLVYWLARCRILAWPGVGYWPGLVWPGAGYWPGLAWCRILALVPDTGPGCRILGQGAECRLRGAAVGACLLRGACGGYTVAVLATVLAMSAYSACRPRAEKRSPGWKAFCGQWGSTHHPPEGQKMSKIHHFLVF